MESENKIYTIRYSYTEIMHESYTVEASSEDEAIDMWNDETSRLDDPEIDSIEDQPAPPWVDPNQLPLPEVFA